MATRDRGNGRVLAATGPGTTGALPIVMLPPALGKVLTLLTLGVAATTACSYPTIALEDKAAEVTPENDFEPAPQRASETTTPSSSADAGPQPATGASGDAGPSPCNDPDLTLCFAFEGDVKDGSPSNASPTTSAAVSFAPGHTGLAALLGETSFIRYSSLPAVTTPSATVEAWLQPSQKRDAVVFDANDRYAVVTYGNGQIGCIGQGGEVRGGAITVGIWAHVACVFDGSKITAYVNGVPVGSGNGKTGDKADAPVAVGGNAPNGNPFVGLLDSVRVFKTGRTAAEVAADATAP
jgi:hypothetical protein